MSPLEFVVVTLLAQVLFWGSLMVLIGAFFYWVLGR